MTEHQFEEGEAVQLKSGGPKMTYVGEDFNGEMMCQWFDKNGTVQKSNFLSSALKKYDEPAVVSRPISRG
jgi:uncharacterized protein YodC (DUF2158 family)